MVQKQNQLKWENAQEPLPSFELTDLHGKTWKPARTDVLFLSLNMDDNPGLIDPFVTDQRLTVTVLPAYRDRWATYGGASVPD